jgi:hypothetical protein
MRVAHGPTLISHCGKRNTNSSSLSQTKRSLIKWYRYYNINNGVSPMPFPSAKDSKLSFYDFAPSFQLFQLPELKMLLYGRSARVDITGIVKNSK